MERSLTPIKRKIIVCVHQGCTECDSQKIDSPEDCPFLILHALDTGIEGVHWMSRQAGKTTMLVEQANKIAESGAPVYFLTVNQDMAYYIRHSRGLDKRVKIFSKGQISYNVDGFPRGWLFVDEVNPKEVEHTGILHRHRLVSAFYT